MSKVGWSFGHDEKEWLPTIEISVLKSNNGKDAKVFLQLDDEFEIDFGYLMVACEYLLHFTAQRSNLSYEQALQKLSEGAKTYRDLTPKTND